MAARLPNDKSIFLEAIEIANPEARAAYPAKACGKDSALLGEVIGLIQAHEKRHTLLDAKKLEQAAFHSLVAEQRAGTIIGPYKLIEQIGDGGMGTVFKAEQTEPVRRLVALKIIRPGMDSRQVIARFEAERQALALMDHPNIAKVLDAGTIGGAGKLVSGDRGLRSEDRSAGHDLLAPDSIFPAAGARPYFVMELVSGEPITTYCDHKKLSLQQRLELFIPVCHAVQHAHQKGIIHRDLKPSNVLVGQYDDRAVPKVIDFGVAKVAGLHVTERTRVTELGQLIGTLEYMSPEQASLNALDVDTRTDIYALGVLLYELLAGSAPLADGRPHELGLDDLLRRIREEEPAPPSSRLAAAPNKEDIAAGRHATPAQLIRQVKGDLDWIVMKAIDKDRNRRYRTPGDLAEDLERYLRQEAVLARPPSATYRLRKFVRRNRVPALAVTAVACGLVLGAILAIWQALEAMQAHEEAIAAAGAAKTARDLAESREAQTRAVVDFLENQILAAARPEGQDGGLGRDIKLREAIEAALPVVDKSFADQPLIAAKLRATLGMSFLYLGEPATGAEQLRLARDLYMKHLGPDHLDTASSMHYLANGYTDLGRYDEALKLREDVLALRQAKLGPDHPETLLSMTSLAVSYSNLGRYKEALELRKKTWALQKAILGPDRANTLNTMSNLANSYSDLGFLREALALREENFARRKAKLGPTHPDTLMSMNGLAASYFALGRFKDATELREKTLALQRDKLGADHPSTLITMAGLAECYAALGKNDDAIELNLKALAASKAKRGTSHAETFNIANNLANVYDDIGNPIEAITLRQETYALRKDKLGFDHPDTLASMNNLANSLMAIGRPADALKLHQGTLQLRQKKLGADHPQTLLNAMNLAGALAALGTHQDALKVREQVLPRLEAKLGSDHPDVLRARGNLANSYAALGRHDEALKLREETLALQKKKLGLNHRDTIRAMNNLAVSYSTLRKHAEALTLNQQSLELWKTNFGAEYFETLLCMDNLALSYAALGRDAEARAVQAERARLTKTDEATEKKE